MYYIYTIEQLSSISPDVQCKRLVLKTIIDVEVQEQMAIHPYCQQHISPVVT